jgi:hypothetical protein
VSQHALRWYCYHRHEALDNKRLRFRTRAGAATNGVNVNHRIYIRKDQYQTLKEWFEEALNSGRTTSSPFLLKKGKKGCDQLWPRPTLHSKEAQAAGVYVTPRDVPRLFRDVPHTILLAMSADGPRSVACLSEIKVREWKNTPRKTRPKKAPKKEAEKKQPPLAYSDRLTRQQMAEEANCCEQTMTQVIENGIKNADGKCLKLGASHRLPLSVPVAKSKHGRPAHRRQLTLETWSRVNWEPIKQCLWETLEAPYTDSADGVVRYRQSKVMARYDWVKSRAMLAAMRKHCDPLGRGVDAQPSRSRRLLLVTARDGATAKKISMTSASW